VILKLVNISPEETDFDIALDCDVEKDYTVCLLTGDPDEKNSLENPRNVWDTEVRKSGASRRFTYRAPGSSINVLLLTKK